MVLNIWYTNSYYFFNIIIIIVVIIIILISLLPTYFLLGGNAMHIFFNILKPIWSTYFIIQVILWKIESNQEAM